MRDWTRRAVVWASAGIAELAAMPAHANTLTSLIQDGTNGTLSAGVITRRGNGTIALAASSGRRLKGPGPHPAMSAFGLDDPFRVASVSKMIATAGFMRLVEKGRVNLEDDAGAHLGFPLRHPGYPDRPILIRHLLSHTSALRNGPSYPVPAGHRLREAFERLAGTRITTNLVAGEHEVTRGFGLIENWEIVRKTRGGRMVQVQVTLSEWLYSAILAKSVLTLNRGYFQLRRPLERRLYELARKHCGRQPEWRISLEVLQKKAGSGSPRRVFRAMLRDVIAAGNIPDYTLALDEGDLLWVTPQAVVVEPSDTKKVSITTTSLLA